MSRMARTTLRVVEFCLCIWAVLNAPARTQAQPGQALPVGVSFEFADSTIMGSFERASDRIALERQVTDQLSTHLRARFHYWTFATASRETRITLKVNLFTETGAVKVAAALMNGPDKVTSWDGVVFKPGETLTRGLPVGAQWTPILTHAFDELLQTHSQEILSVLKEAAPVGREIVFMPAADDPGILPRAVLALDSDEYNDLLDCQFRLRYDWSAGGRVTIHSSGISMHAPFETASPPFEGIVVQLEEWQQGSQTRKIELMRNHLQELTPVEFYLEAIKGPGTE
jgi:hypothetical protein